MPCTRSCAIGESKWTVVVPGMRWRNWEILLLSEVARTVSMVVKSRSLDGLHSTRGMITALRALLMLSLMATSGVVRVVPSLLMMSLRLQRVKPFLGEGALDVDGAGATAGVGFADSVAFFFFPFLATCAHVEGGGGFAPRSDGGGGGGGEAAGAGVDHARSHSSRCMLRSWSWTSLRSFLSCLVSLRVC